jgi:peptidoglycan/LPS O-acetylase OafA/YrhL
MIPTSTLPTLNKHITGFDWGRGMGAVAVMYAHSSLMVDAGIIWLEPGQLGVRMFMVISGFLITMGLLADHGKQGALLKFWNNRQLARILPLYLAVLSIMALLGYHVGPQCWFYYANYEVPIMELRHTWSLSVEEQFYVVWPFIILFMSRKSSYVVCWVVLAASLIWAGYECYISGFRGVLLSKLYFYTQSNMALFAIGSILAYHPAWFRSIAALKVIIGVFVGLSVVRVCLYPFGVSNGEIFVFHLMSIALATLIVNVLVCREYPVIVHHVMKPFAWVGKISYGVYLIHFPLFIGMGVSMHDESNPVRLAVVIAITIGLAYLSFHYFETPVRRFFYRELPKTN